MSQIVKAVYTVYLTEPIPVAEVDRSAASSRSRHAVGASAARSLPGRHLRDRRMDMPPNPVLER